MANVNEVTVRLHDDGIVEASLKGSSIHAIGFPRDKRNVKFVKDSLSEKVGVYMLIGRNKPPSAKLEVYIGQGTKLANRLSSHHSQHMIDNANNWFETVVIYDSKGDMTVKNAKAVEGSLIGVCRQNTRWKTSNKKGTSEEAASEEKYVVDTIEKTIVLTRILGWDVFNDFRDAKSKPTKNIGSIAPISSGVSKVFAYQTKYFKAEMRVGSFGEIIVLEGSQANLNTLRSARPQLQHLRNELIRQGLLIEEDNKLVFTREYHFHTPSAAGSVVAGYAVNGNMVWKLPDGTRYGEWLQAD